MLGQESLEETKLTIFLSHCEKRKKTKIQSMIVDAVWTSFFFLVGGGRFVLDSMGCNQEGGGGGGDVRYSTPQKQGARGVGEETGVVEEGMGKGGEGGARPDHSFTFFLHFYFRHWKRKQKKSAKRERKVITSQLADTKRRISRRT